MENNAIKLKNYEKLVDELGHEIAELYVICGALEEIVEQTNKHPKIYQKFATVLYLFYRLAYNELYQGISRLIDETKGVISIIKLLQMSADEKPLGRIELAKIEKELTDKIKANKALKKIKNYRQNKLGHKNKRLVLDALLEKQFRENNKMELEEIVSLLHFLGDALKRASERASFNVLTIPTTPIRSEIKSLFDLLSQKKSEF